jgi:hypothetical protein
MLCCKAVYGGRLWRPVLILELHVWCSNVLALVLCFLPICLLLDDDYMIMIIHMVTIFLRASAYVCVDFPSRKILVHHFLAVIFPTVIVDNGKKMSVCNEEQRGCKAYESTIFGSTVTLGFQYTMP